MATWYKVSDHIRDVAEIRTLEVTEETEKTVVVIGSRNGRRMNKVTSYYKLFPTIEEAIADVQARLDRKVESGKHALAYAEENRDAFRKSVLEREKKLEEGES